MKTPETNQVAAQYLYNNFGLVTQRTDPRGVITTYGYDNLNRLSGITYNMNTTGVTATPGVTLTYDQGALPHTLSVICPLAPRTESYDTKLS